MLGEHDVLKVSDFGLATVFRHKGKERLLERKCGTRPYIAPEILTRPTYNAEPADLWSCGMVLLAMLTGGKILGRVFGKNAEKYCRGNEDLWKTERRWARKILLQVCRLSV